MSTTTAAPEGRATRRGFIAAGTVISVAAIVGVVLSLTSGATLFTPFAVALLGLGVLYVWGGRSGYVTEPVPVRYAEADEDPNASLFWWGMLLAVLIPIVGFIIGVVILIRGSNGYGLRLMVGSIGLTILYSYLIFGR